MEAAQGAQEAALLDVVRHDLERVEPLFGLVVAPTDQREHVVTI